MTFYASTLRTGLLTALIVSVSPLAAQQPNSARAAIANQTDQTIHLGTFSYQQGQLRGASSSRSTVLWDNSVGTGLFLNSQGQEILDTGDLPNDLIVGEFELGFATDASGSVTIRYNFYQNNNSNSVGSLLTTVGGGIATYEMTVDDLPGGGFLTYIMNVKLAPEDSFIISGPDTDSNPGSDWGWGFTAIDVGNATQIGPIVSAEGAIPGAPGREDNYDVFTPDVATGTYTGTMTVGPQFSQFHMLLREAAVFEDGFEG